MKCLFCMGSMRIGTDKYFCSDLGCPLSTYDNEHDCWMVSLSFGGSMLAMLGEGPFSTDELKRLLKLKAFW